MKLSTKIILPIILISAMLILLVGCFVTPTEEQPGLTSGSIIGIVATPCCLTSSTPVSEDIAPYNWCLQCTKNWFLWADVEVVLTAWIDSVEVELAKVNADKNGNYTFLEVPTGKNYVITAICPTDENYVIKDVAEEVLAGETYDAQITDCESTALGLVLEFLLDYAELSPEDIDLKGVIADSYTEFASFPRFKKLVKEVCRVLEDCGGVYEDSKVEDAVCLAAEEISSLDLACSTGPGYTPSGDEDTTTEPFLESISVSTDPEVMILCLTGTGLPDSGTIVTTAHYSDGSSAVVTPDLYDGYDAGIVSVDANGNVSSVGLGTTTITVHFEGETADVAVEVEDCTFVESISVDPEVMNLCLTGTGLPDSGTIVTTAHYSDGSSAVVTPDFYDGYDAGIVSVDANGNVSSVGLGTTTITVHFEGETALVTVYIVNCSPYIPDTYTLTMAVYPTDSGTTTPSVGGSPHNYFEGTVVDITAYPALGLGYQFVSWTGDVVDPDSPNTTILMNSNKSVTANFTKEKVTLTMAVVGSGSTSPAVGTYTLAYDYGDIVDISALADTGSVFTGWSANPNIADTAADATTVTMIGDQTATANFTKEKVTLTMAVVGSGSTSPAVGTYTLAYDYGDIVDISALADTGSVFTGWSANPNIADTAADATTVTMIGDQTATANFTKEKVTLTMAVVGSGSTSPAVGTYTLAYDYGDIVDISALADTGSVFTGWSANPNIADTAADATTVTMIGDQTATANFTKEKVTLTMAVVGSGSTSPAVGTYTLAYDYGDIVDISALADTGSVFTGWSANPNIADTAADATTVTMIGDQTATANFTKEKVTLTMAVVGSGSTSPAVGTYTLAYDYGDIVDISALADTGSVFTGWSANPNIADTAADATTVTMIGDQTATANFTCDPCSPDGWGSTSVIVEKWYAGASGHSDPRVDASGTIIPPDCMTGDITLTLRLELYNSGWHLQESVEKILTLPSDNTFNETFNIDPAKYNSIQNYKLMIKPDGCSNWIEIATGTVPVKAGY